MNEEAKTGPVWSHFYTRGRLPVVTVCYFSGSGHTAVGLSICSPRDMPCKKVGRRISLERAKFAIRSLAVNQADNDRIGHSCSEIRRDEALNTLLDSDLVISGLLGFGVEGQAYKIMYANEDGFRFERRPRPGREGSESGTQATPLLSSEETLA